MSKTKYIVILVLLTTSLIQAELLQTSDHLSNLKIVTDADCQRTQPQVNVQVQADPELKAPSEFKVETVNYKLHVCDGLTSFPVTVRANKMRGSN